MVIASMSSRIEAFAQLLTLLIIFIFVLAVTYYVTRFVGNYQKNKLSGSNINILETMRIANNKYIQIVKIGSRVFAIAVAKDTVSYLCELDEDELIYKESSSGKMLINNDDFKEILIKPKNSIVKQYKTLFKLDGIDLEFSQDAIDYIAHQAKARGVGARGLKSIISDKLNDLMYELPMKKEIDEFVITKEYLIK